MERLTKTVNGVVTYIGTGNKFDTGMLPAELSSGQIREVMNRLSAYEELMERWKLRSIEEADRIFQRVNALGGTDLMAQYRAIGSIDHLRDLIKAEQDGRLVVLPCKVGDTVYRVTSWVEDRCKRTCFFCGTDCPEFRRRDGTIIKYGVAPLEMKSIENVIGVMHRMGKTVFLTREGAEASLAQKGGEG